MATACRRLTEDVPLDQEAMIVPSEQSFSPTDRQGMAFGGRDHLMLASYHGP